MIYPKIYCERDVLSYQHIIKILHNISINEYGFTHVDNNTITFLDNLGCTLLYYDVTNSINKYSTFPITCSTEWLFIQTLLNQLDGTTKSNIINALKECPHKMLLIINTALSLPVNYDIKCIIISNIFINFEALIKFYTIINETLLPFCVKFGRVCELIRPTTQNDIIKKLMNHFALTKMDKYANIMCISESFTICMVYNEYNNFNFTMLTFDNASDKVSIYPICTSSNICYSIYILANTLHLITNNYIIVLQYITHNC